eukprot:CAMPEP_0185846750 /NCGR_PEP_ID=MMETSP1354-20130828/2277_1 /TAXON_ID=708628 /ORGANISM="Erythrolobus madagascarensis, Strain CCMP3276" /LENGTH=882 /DNA_ID=CAMNT_0028546951 /DNA_START=15 /DNA_END=2663 /DNA_ORIENTATION=-
MDVELAIERQLNASSEEQWAEVTRPSKKFNEPSTGHTHAPRGGGHGSSGRQHAHSGSHSSRTGGNEHSRDRRGGSGGQNRHQRGGNAGGTSGKNVHKGTGGANTGGWPAPSGGSGNAELEPEWAKPLAATGGARKAAAGDQASSMWENGLGDKSVDQTPESGAGVNGAAGETGAIEKPKMNFAAALARGTQPAPTQQRSAAGGVVPVGGAAATAPMGANKSSVASTTANGSLSKAETAAKEAQLGLESAAQDNVDASSAAGARTSVKPSNTDSSGVDLNAARASSQPPMVSVGEKPNAWNNVASVGAEQSATSAGGSKGEESGVGEINLQFGSFSLGHGDRVDWSANPDAPKNNVSSHSQTNAVGPAASTSTTTAAAASEPKTSSSSSKPAAAPVPKPAGSDQAAQTVSETASTGAQAGGAVVAAAVAPGAAPQTTQQQPAGVAAAGNAPAVAQGGRAMATAGSGQPAVAAPAANAGVVPSSSMYNPVYSTPYGMVPMPGYAHHPAGAYSAAPAASPPGYYDMSKYGAVPHGMMNGGSDVGVSSAGGNAAAGSNGTTAVSGGAGAAAGTSANGAAAAGGYRVVPPSDKNAAAAAQAAAMEMNAAYMLPPGFSPALAAQYASMYGYNPYGAIPPNHPAYAQYGHTAQTSYGSYGSYAAYPTGPPPTGAQPAVATSGKYSGKGAAGGGGAQSVSGSASAGGTHVVAGVVPPQQQHHQAAHHPQQQPPQQQQAYAQQHHMYAHHQAALDDGASAAGAGANAKMGVSGVSPYGQDAVGYQYGTAAGGGFGAGAAAASGTQGGKYPSAQNAQANWANAQSGAAARTSDVSGGAAAQYHQQQQQAAGGQQHPQGASGQAPHQQQQYYNQSYAIPNKLQVPSGHPFTQM